MIFGIDVKDGRIACLGKFWREDKVPQTFVRVSEDVFAGLELGMTVDTVDGELVFGAALEVSADD